MSWVKMVQDRLMEADALAKEAREIESQLSFDEPFKPGEKIALKCGETNYPPYSKPMIYMGLTKTKILPHQVLQLIHVKGDGFETKYAVADTFEVFTGRLPKLKEEKKK